MAIWPGNSLSAFSADEFLQAGPDVAAGLRSSTMSGWQELVASLPFTVNDMWFEPQKTNNSFESSDWFRIGVGSAGSEEELGRFYVAGKQSKEPRLLHVPLQVAAGERLVVEYSDTNNNVLMRLMLPIHGWQRPQAYGELLSLNTTAVMYDPGGTANTKGPWTEITASTEAAFRKLFVSGWVPSSTMSACVNFFDVGIGPAGSEEVIAENMLVEGTTGESFDAPQEILCDIPAGTRVAFRGQSSITDATDRQNRVWINGMR